MQKSLTYKTIEETDSTIRYMREEMPEDGRFMTIVRAEYQTAGRGQGTNTWESERGKNLLCSIRISPEKLPANRQYAILQAAALAVKDTLARYTGGSTAASGADITIKWPNDIYWHDRKISGTLTECAISRGMVRNCIIGIGVNINQEVFTSDAHNPISLCTVTGRKECINDICIDIARLFGSHLADYINTGTLHHLHDRYLHSLYRREGIHPYRDAEGCFDATIETVEPDGRIVLRDTDGRLRRYAFKEVEFIIPSAPTAHTAKAQAETT